MPADDLIVDQLPFILLPSISCQRSAQDLLSRALAAFASAANAGILAAARYPMAMSRDGLAGTKFLELSRFGTPI